MSRLIDADALFEKVKESSEDAGFYTPIYNGFLASIVNAPTIEQPLTVKEKADIHRICKGIERKCRDMMQLGMWERYTRHMECGEIREFAQYYRDMETVYKALTGVELFPEPPKEDE